MTAYAQRNQEMTPKSPFSQASYHQRFFWIFTSGRLYQCYFRRGK